MLGKSSTGNLKMIELMFMMKVDKDIRLSPVKTLFNKLTKWFERDAGRFTISELIVDFPKISRSSFYNILSFGDEEEVFF